MEEGGLSSARESFGSSSAASTNRDLARKGSRALSKEGGSVHASGRITPQREKLKHAAMMPGQMPWRNVLRDLIKTAELAGDEGFHGDMMLALHTRAASFTNED